jgi:HD-GYP domain-containing protein (c-di-GMP phosphodiesterase class II)
MKTHVEIGVNILKPIKGLKEIADGCKYHHERWDGKGYPYGLKGEEIPLIGRIVSVVDSYDTMVTSRPYQKGRSPQEAFTELKRCSGTQFDPSIVEIFEDAWVSGNIKRRDYKALEFTKRR